MKKSTKVAKKAAAPVKKHALEKKSKEPRVSAADVLVPQFGLKSVKSNEELIKLVRSETGSTKFDEKQLAWYKSQFRGGKLKGQDGKAGHPIAQGSMLKKGTVRPVKRQAAQAEEPIED
jgi:hypothetical protein